MNLDTSERTELKAPKIDEVEIFQTADREVARLARAGGALRLRVGEALEALCRAGGHHELGFSSPGAYVRQRCGRGPRWGQEARSLARRLAELPCMRRAVYAGEISWSMAQVLASQANADTEQALVEEARGTTVRAMRVRFRERAEAARKETGREAWAEAVGTDCAETAEPGAETDPPGHVESEEAPAAAGGTEPPHSAEDEGEEPRRVVSTLVSREDAWMWEATLKIIEHVSGHRLSFDDRVEAVLAEAWTTMLEGIPPGMDVAPRSGRRKGEHWERWREQMAKARASEEERAEKRVPLGEPIEVALPAKLAPTRGTEVAAYGPVRVSYMQRLAAHGRISPGAARVYESLTWGIDTEKLNEILREQGLPSTYEELLAQREAAELGASSAPDATAADPEATDAHPRTQRREATGSNDSSDETCETDDQRDPSEPWRPEEIDLEIRALVAELQARDLELGRALLALFRKQGWRLLGYASDTQYARERVGMSLSAVKAHIALARRSEFYPEIAEAAANGRIGFEAARQVARVALHDTVEAWLKRATERTAKHLREEVEAIELVARCEGEGEILAWGPPDEETLEAIFDIEREIRQGAPMAAGGIRLRSEPGDSNDSGQFSAPTHNGDATHAAPGDPGQMSAPTENGDATHAAPGDPGQMSAPTENGGATHAAPGDGLSPHAGKTTLRLYLREDLADLWDSLKTLWLRWRARLGLPSFLRTLCWSVWHAWGPSLGPTGVAYEDIYIRDRWMCTSPVCERTDQTPHHLKYRSQGGTDDEKNLTGPCLWCHLEGIHTGRLGAEPPAPHIRWRIGRTGLLRVDGRRLMRQS